jgi:hypothetical protein
VLEVRAEALVDTFKTQKVANTLWAYSTMVRKHIKQTIRLTRRMMGLESVYGKSTLGMLVETLVVELVEW